MAFDKRLEDPSFYILHEVAAEKSSFRIIVYFVEKLRLRIFMEMALMGRCAEVNYSPDRPCS